MTGSPTGKPMCRRKRQADAAALGETVGIASHEDEIVVLRVDYFENYAGRFLSVEAKDRLGGATPTGSTYVGPSALALLEHRAGTPISSTPRVMNVNIDPDTTPDTYIEHRELVRIGDAGTRSAAAADDDPDRLEHRSVHRGSRAGLARRRPAADEEEVHVRLHDALHGPDRGLRRASTSSRRSSRTSPR